MIYTARKKKLTGTTKTSALVATTEVQLLHNKGRRDKSRLTESNQMGIIKGSESQQNRPACETAVRRSLKQSECKLQPSSRCRGRQQCLSTSNKTTYFSAYY